MLLGLSNKVKETDSNLDSPIKRYKSLNRDRFEKRETNTFLESNRSMVDRARQRRVGCSAPARGELVGLRPN